MSDWETRTLGEVAEIERGKFTHRPRNDPRFYGGSTPFVQTGDITRSNGIVRTHTQTLNDEGVAISRVFPAGTILITIAANIGYAGILEFDSAAPDSLIGITVNGSVRADFLNFYLRTQQPEMDRLAPKGTQKNINIQFLKPWPVPLPPLPEQTQIAHILSTVQRAISAQERIIQATTELKKALMHKLFTEGLPRRSPGEDGPPRNEPQKQTEIGPVPESWEVVSFADSVSIKNGQVDPRLHPFVEMLHVGSENIESDTGQLVKLSTNRELKISSGNYHFTRDEVLYSKIRPYLNKVALPDFEGTCSADMYPLRSESHFIREFLFYYLLSDEFKKAAMSFQDRTGIPKINRAQLGSIHLVCPSKEEQAEIAEALLSCDSKRDLAQRKKTQLQDLFRTLLHELMTAKTRVPNEIDPGSKQQRKPKP